MAVTLPKKGTEEYWTARDDVRTLTRAQEIRSDSNRMGMALAMMEEEKKQLNAAVDAVKNDKPLPNDKGGNSAGDSNPATISPL